MKKRTAKERELADDARLLRAWHKWHAEELAEALAGPHGPVVVQVVEFLKTMTPASADALLALMHSRTWSDVDADTRFTLLHEVNRAITNMREKNNMAAIDDPLPPARLSVFQTIKNMLFP